MKYLSIFFLILLFSCHSREEKNNTISFEISKAVHVKMTFERLCEFENNKEKKKELIFFLKSLDIDSNPGFIGWRINKSKQQILDDFIEENRSELLLDKHHSFLWKKEKNDILLFQKNDKETLDLTKAITSYIFNNNSIEINIIPEGIKALRTYNLQGINKTFLLQINKKLISVATGLGDFKDGTLKIKNIDSKTINEIK